ncbi:TPA: hypothetical protein HA278_00890 [Candidatus Woesearchaeota archaeon]|nr:hypothetical protein [archaeon]HIJ10587.1 hypothetical protein [Candidatus Woesearchaeota archaeon]|tara:strand:+ start:49 stop:396 length:348 start_codon:yes stop_codon:yes gene_type:complete
MATPQFIEESTLSLADVKAIMAKVTKREEELNYRSNKAKEFVENFQPALSLEKATELKEKLLGLGLTRLKEEHVSKIIDFLPTKVVDLKTVLAAYPLSMPKKDMDAIVATVKEFA